MAFSQEVTYVTSLSDSIPENIIYPETLRRECVRSLCMHIRAPALIPRDLNKRQSDPHQPDLAQAQKKEFHEM